MRPALIGVLVFFVAAAVFLFGVVIGGGTAIVDRVASLFEKGTPVPTPTPVLISSAAIVREIQQVGRLETTVFTIERMVEVKQTDSFWPAWLVGDRVLLIASGTVVAGVDLNKLTTKDVIVAADGKSATINLPPVEIFNAAHILNNTRTRVYDRQRGILTPLNADLETTARQAAEAQILAAAYEEGILERATTDAQRALEQLLGLLELKVVVKSAPVPPYQ